MMNIIIIKTFILVNYREFIYLLRCLESKSNIAVKTGRFHLLTDELDVAVKVNTFLLLESAFNLK